LINPLKDILFRWNLPALPCDPDSFRHATSSCHGRVPKLFKYKFVRPGISKKLPFLLLENKNILNYKKYQAAKYFGWITESSEIIEDSLSLIKNKINELEKVFIKIFTSDQRLLSKSSLFEMAPNGSTLPWIQPIPLYFKKEKLISIVASTKNQTEGHMLREKAIKKFQPLDVFGRGRLEIQKKEEALWPYFFSVVIENASYPNYFTEKITDCFMAKTVPIYWGSPTIHEHFNKSGILSFGQTSRSCLSYNLYQRLLPGIEENFKKTFAMELPDDIIFNKIKKYL